MNPVMRLAAAALLVACGNGDPGGTVDPSADAGASFESSVADTGAADVGRDEAGDGGAYTPIRLGSNDLCLGFPVARNGAMAACRVLLDAVTGGCGQPGLSQAPPEDLAAVSAILLQMQAQPLPPGGLCVLDQIATSAPGDGCSDPQAIGWCYELGPCIADAGLKCKQAICATDGFAGVHFMDQGAWLACP